jgi:hypothetical protein
MFFIVACTTAEGPMTTVQCIEEKLQNFDNKGELRLMVSKEVLPVQLADLRDTKGSSLAVAIERMAELKIKNREITQ